MKLNYLILIMAMAAESNLIADGDAAFYRVDTRTPAHELPKTVAADAVNKRFEDGRAWPRFGVDQGPWGAVQQVWINQTWAPLEFLNQLNVNLTAGKIYTVLAAGNATVFTGPILNGAGNPIYVCPPNTVLILDNGVAPVFASPGVPFVCPTGAVTIWILQQNFQQLAGQQITTQLVEAGNVWGYARFNDPQGLDVLVVATDAWRSGAGEDGGRGRVWKILDGNVPVEVPLNGNDIDGTCRFIPCFNALVLLRQENERHYFNAAAVANPAANKIQLNCLPTWVNGDQVFLWGDITKNSNLTGAAAPAIMSYAFVKNLGNNVVSLYADSALTQLLTFTGAVGRFYLERDAGTPGPFGNLQPPIMAQPNAAGNTLWEVGFAAVPVNLNVTNTTAATGVWTVPNHRLNPGDQITLANMPNGHTPANGNYYVWTLNANQLQLFDTQAHALLAGTGSTAGLKAISNDGETAPTMAKTGASGLPMPPATEGFYTENNRLVLVNGNNLVISDPLDPLHYTPMSATLTADLGEADAVTCVSSFIAGNCLVIGKQKSILAIYNWAQGPTQWQLQSVTREYGCIAPLSMRQWGNQLMFLSRRGLDSVQLSAFGVIVPTVKPVSFAMQKYVNRLDWNNAALSVVETWSNRLFWSVKLKGQPGTTNNALMALNFLNSDPEKQVFGWEGVWLGDGLTAIGLAKHTIAGEERLTFLNQTGQVCWLGDGVLDQPGNLPINDSLTTRVYSGGSQGRKIFNKALCIWDTNNAAVTVTATTPGWNENTVLTPAGGLSYNPLAYGAGPNQTYNPATQQPPFNTPFREDYALQNVGEIIGGQPDVLQNHSEPFRLREDDWGVQFTIANASGQLRLVSVSVAGFAGPSSDRSRV